MAGRSRPVSECAVIGPAACSRCGISGLKNTVSFAGFAVKNPAAKARGGVTQLNVMIMKKIPRPRYRNAIGNLSIERNGAPSYCTLRKRNRRRGRVPAEDRAGGIGSRTDRLSLLTLPCRRPGAKRRISGRCRIRSDDYGREKHGPYPGRFRSERSGHSQRQLFRIALCAGGILSGADSRAVGRHRVLPRRDGARSRGDTGRVLAGRPVRRALSGCMEMGDRHGRTGRYMAAA